MVARGVSARLTLLLSLILGRRLLTTVKCVEDFGIKKFFFDFTQVVKLQASEFFIILIDLWDNLDQFLGQLIHEVQLFALHHDDAFLDAVEHFLERVLLHELLLDFLSGLVLELVDDVDEAQPEDSCEQDGDDYRRPGVVTHVVKFETRDYDDNHLQDHKPHLHSHS